MSASDFRKLEVWKKARTLAIEIYRITSDGPLARDFGLRDQMMIALSALKLRRRPKDQLALFSMVLLGVLG